MKPVFVIRPEGLDGKPSVSLQIEEPPAEKLEGAIVRPLVLCQDSLPIFRRTRSMVPSIDPILAKLCLTGWQMKAKPEECEPKKGMWHVQVETQLDGLKSFAYPFFVGDDGLLGIASPFRSKGGTVTRARQALEWVEPDRLPYLGFFQPLQTMPFSKTVGIYMLACNAVMAGWDQ